jgi:translation initiation factor eIF-2B subunit beta
MSPNSEDAHATQQMSDPSVVRAWLASPYHAKQLALLDKFEIELRLGRLTSTSGSSSSISSTGPRMDRRAVTVRTVELLRAMIGGTRWRTPAELVNLLRGLGRELHSAGGFREPAIGNVVRRIIAAVREEVMNGTAETEVDGSAPNTNKPNVSRTKQHDRSLESMLWALPQHVKPSRATAGQRRPASQQHQRSESLGDVMETDSASSSIDLPPQFHQNRPDLKQSIMEAIQEITSDLEDLHKNINDQATNHIHAGEVILTYGKSRTVQMVRTVRRVATEPRFVRHC